MYNNSLFNYVFNGFKFNRSLLIEPIPDLRSPFEGILYISIGVVSIILYIPFFFAIIDKKNYKFPAYKIMAQMAVFDILNLFILGVLSGINSIMGLSYWNAPFLSIFYCESGYFLWCSVNGNLIVLATQRCIQIISPSLADDLFAGSKTYIWLIIPLLITAAMITFNPMLIYTPVLNMCFLDPFLGYPNKSTTKYDSIFQFLENVVNSTFLISIYIIFFIILLIKKKETEVKVKKNGTTDSQNVILLIQTASICSITLASNVLYIVEGYIPLPQFTLTVTQSITLLVHSFPPVIYMMFNNTLKNTIRGYFKKNKSVAVSMVGKSISIRSAIPVQVI
uniref:G_PROTEIN_RECEP_F1_2 domain-containing protein n=1 Tax=Rhabditophanes sp. KR3021 TaxID=114890 RepID=A0AC35TXS7_9BILA